MVPLGGIALEAIERSASGEVEEPADSVQWAAAQSEMRAVAAYRLQSVPGGYRIVHVTQGLLLKRRSNC